MRQLIEKEKYLSKIISELKIPTVAQINALKTILKTTKQKFSSDETELIELTLCSCSHMQKLIDAISRVITSSPEKISLTYQRFNIVDLTNEIISELEILLKYTNLKIERKFGKEIIISADKNKIKTVIENILSNTIKNACKNSTIQIQITKNESEVQFTVKSNNSYIEKGILGEIFSKSKADTSLLKHSGTELRLYLSKEIISAHFGYMILKNCNDGKNILGFSLPN